MNKLPVVKQSPGGPSRAELRWAQLDSPHPRNPAGGLTITLHLKNWKSSLNIGVHYKLPAKTRSPGIAAALLLCLTLSHCS